MQTTILLIRHGLTDWNAEHRWQGHEDIPLNATGTDQARALARRLAGWPIQALYSSDLLRAAQTADILAAAVGLPVTRDSAWRERDVGAFQGLTHAEIQAQYPNEFAEMTRGTINPPHGEDTQKLHARAVSAFDKLVTRHAGQMVAVVSHGGLLHTALLYVLGLPIGEYDRLSLRGNTGISIVEIGNGRPRLSRLNDTAHLEI
ncbi:MAG: histidine phosphatase family protein [Chloroflexi bacterium]|jgi:broad specificity phosphatase PhoE|nr:histidine phosphatase family protein [Chloroflexota bacterium]